MTKNTNMKRYKTLGGDNTKVPKQMVIPIFIPHKGCPFDCIYCNQKTISGQTQEIEISDIHTIIKKYLNTSSKDSKIEVGFYGGSFTGIEKSLQIDFLKAAYSYIKSGDIKGIRLSTRPDYIDSDILGYLKDYGVKTIELGVQSLDNEVLSASNRGHSREVVYNSSKLIKEAGFELGIQTMIGLPKDNMEKDLLTAQEVLKLAPQIVRIYPTLVIKNTFLENLMNSGKYQPLKLEEAVDICSELLDIYENKGIHVIRIGLQPTESINEGMDVVAGPFHPAFRQLVESRSFLNSIEKQILKNNLNTETSLVITTKQKFLSSVIGQKRNNIKFLINKFSFKNIKVEVNNEISNKFEINF